MPGSRLEAAVSGMVARARLYERVAHDARPWVAWIRGAEHSVMIPLERHERDDRVVLTGYLHAPLAGITAVDVWSGEDMVMSRPFDPPADGPFRICFCLCVEDAELAA